MTNSLCWCLMCVKMTKSSNRRQNRRIEGTNTLGHGTLLEPRTVNEETAFTEGRRREVTGTSGFRGEFPTKETSERTKGVRLNGEIR